MLVNIWDFALQEHYKLNGHHPEHYDDVAAMTTLDRQEMLADLLASAAAPLVNVFNEQHYLQPVLTMIPQFAYICKGWPKWNIVSDLYKGTYKTPHCLLNRPRWCVRDPTQFLEYAEEYNGLKLQAAKIALCIATNKTDDIATSIKDSDLDPYPSIKIYKKDLKFHKFAVNVIGNKLFGNDDNFELIRRLYLHDNDKEIPWMCLVYTLKWLFNTTTIEITEL